MHEGVARVLRLNDGELLAVVPIASIADVHLILDAAPRSMWSRALTSLRRAGHADGNETSAVGADDAVGG